MAALRAVVHRYETLFRPLPDEVDEVDEGRHWSEFEVSEEGAMKSASRWKAILSDNAILNSVDAGDG